MKQSETSGMTPELQERLKNACDRLPTPSGIASEIVRLARDPDADLRKVSEVLALDPSLTVRVLRLANSPLYGQSGHIDSVRQASVVLGLDATLSLALCFSLVRSWSGADAQPSPGLEYSVFWRRALLAAASGSELAATIRRRKAEDLFLTCLVQDIGVLALDAAGEGLYAELDETPANHAALIRREMEHLGTDHAAVGAWLLEQWHFPDLIVQGVAGSHDPQRVSPSHPMASFVRAVALSSLIADIFLAGSGRRQFKALARTAREHLDIDASALGELIGRISRKLPQLEDTFEMRILSGGDAAGILEEAHEALSLRTVRTLQAMESQSRMAADLAFKARRLEEENVRDGLTGLYNRSHLDSYLAEAFRLSNLDGAPLSIAFVDLDGFKAINDSFGHLMGDQVLRAVSELLRGLVRSSDVIARYGGDEFVLVFPQTNAEQVRIICERIVETCEQTPLEVGGPSNISATLSIGVATHGSRFRFATVAEFVAAADRILYMAKFAGRNRCLVFDFIA